MALEVTLEVCYKVVFDDNDHNNQDDLWAMEPQEVREYAERQISVSSNMKVFKALFTKIEEDAPDEPENSIRFPFDRDPQGSGEDAGDE